MQVYLIPVGDRRYELYCEVDDDGDEDGDAAGGANPGFFRRTFASVRDRLRQAEHELHYGSTSTEPRTWSRKLSDSVLCWMAEKIAEQRLLWHLRRLADADLIYPADLSEAEAIATLKQSLKRDADRHGLWFIVDGLGFALSGFLFLIPGPNIVAYYFAFRAVGHALSWKGARQGLVRVAWHAIPSEPLRELRRAISLEPTQRERRVLDIASELRLERLPTFFERTVVPGA